MFVSIDTKGATELVIYVPQESAATGLPALANLLENNLVAVKVDYNEVTRVTPDMRILLGNEYVPKVNTYGSDAVPNIVITAPEITPMIEEHEFTISTPSVWLSVNKQLQELYKKLRTAQDLSNVYKTQLEEAQEKLELLVSVNGED